jgi:hypothetical protein
VARFGCQHGRSGASRRWRSGRASG